MCLTISLTTSFLDNKHPTGCSKMTVVWLGYRSPVPSIFRIQFTFSTINKVYKVWERGTLALVLVICLFEFFRKITGSMCYPLPSKSISQWAAPWLLDLMIPSVPPPSSNLQGVEFGPGEGFGFLI